MDIGTFQELLSPAGQAVLAAATALQPSDAAFLQSFDRLRKHAPPELAKAALETVLLRQRARVKFSAADRMYFTREALEQASGEVVAKYRTARFRPFGTVADLCCGIGGDTVAFATAGLTVHAVESDPLRAAMARANAVALGVAERVIVHEADALTVPLPGVRAAFADPARRSSDRRHLAPEDYTPPLSALRGRFPAGFPIGVKVAPGVALNDITGLDAETEFISVAREMKECVLWFGELGTTGRRATVLPAGVTLFAEEPPDSPPLSEVRGFVFDPDAAVVRAGLAGQLAADLRLAPIDYTVAVFTGDEAVASPFVTGFRVGMSGRFHLAKLRDHLRASTVGRVTIIKRGSALDADDVMRKLKLNGREHRVVFLTRCGDEQTMIVGERVEGRPEG